VLGEHAHAEARVERHRVDPRESAGVAALLFELLDPSESDVRLSSRLVRGESIRLQALRLHLDVEAHLVAHLGLGLLRAPERPPLPPQAFGKFSQRQISRRVAISASAMFS
jgi:hypothetical protein